ncbi:MAG TPA: hypothetical protein DCE43_00570, partial [Planctomycetaceae bacterium]|nr:hypothetical protein [Planctomycetaceae bacterium]
MKKKMQRFAVGAKCGGVIAAGESLESNEARATPPRPLAELARNSRRVAASVSKVEVMAMDLVTEWPSVACQKFIQV